MSLTAQLPSLRPLYEQALAEREKESGPASSAVARAASDLGLYLLKQGSAADAEAPLRRALTIDEQANSPAISADRENVALVLEATRRPREAFDLYEKAAAGPDPAIASRSFMRLGALDPAHAAAYYRNALHAEESASGKDSPQVALILNSLALATHDEELFRRALAIQEKTLGHLQPATAAILNNLGSLLESAGKLEEAERLEREALRVAETTLGPERLEVAAACNNLADLLWTKGDRAGAAAMYRRTIAIDEANYGPVSAEVAGDLSNLGLLLREMENAKEAASVLARALAIYEKTSGPSSEQASEIRRLLR